jgi:membrane fusion protein
MHGDSMDEALPLFRQEAVAAANGQYFGKVLIHQSWGFYLAAFLAAGLILLISLFAYFGTYTRKATVTGILVPEHGMLRLTTPSTGLIKDVRGREGQVVKKNDVLFTISGERLSEAGGAQGRIGEQLEQRQHLLQRNQALARERFNAQIDALDRRLTNVSSEISRFHDELGLLDRRVALAAAHLARQQELQGLGFISVAQLQLAEAELLILQGQYHSLKRARNTLERERTELHTQRQEAELRLSNDLADIASEISRIKQEQVENDARAQLVIVAPFAGTLTGLNVQVGQQVATGVLLASLIPEGATLTAQLYAAPQQAGFIEAGQPVLMRYTAYPYQKFGMARGHVAEVARSPYASQELPALIANAVQGKGGAADLFYRITVELNSPMIELYGERHPLKAGMLLEADIVQDKRRLYEWVLDPIYAVTGKLSD